MFLVLNRFSGMCSDHHWFYAVRARSLRSLWIVVQGLLMALVAAAILGGVDLPLRGASGEMILGLGTLRSAVYSLDGKYIATAGSLGAFLWDADTGAMPRPPARALGQLDCHV